MTWQQGARPGDSICGWPAANASTRHSTRPDGTTARYPTSTRPDGSTSRPAASASTRHSTSSRPNGSTMGWPAANASEPRNTRPYDTTGRWPSEETSARHPTITKATTDTKTISRHPASSSTVPSSWPNGSIGGWAAANASTRQSTSSRPDGSTGWWPADIAGSGSEGSQCTQCICAISARPLICEDVATLWRLHTWQPSQRSTRL